MCNGSNLPSLTKFEKDVVEGGVVIVNSSLIEKKVDRTDVKSYYVPASEIAVEIGNAKVANMVMLGAYLEINPAVKVETIIEALKKVFGPSKAHLLPLNETALRKGAEAVK